ncbi:hypothetical protein Hanom_Chr09g00810471 [Helianthus anomalus]
MFVKDHYHKVDLANGSDRVGSWVKTGSGQNRSIIKKGCFGSSRNGSGSERVRVGIGLGQNGSGSERVRVRTGFGSGRVKFFYNITLVIIRPVSTIITC